MGRKSPPDPARAQALNRAIARGAANGAPYANVSAPALGSAVSARDVDLLLLDAWLERPSAKLDALAKALLERLGRLNRKLALKGEVLEGDAAKGRAEALAEEFAGKVAPLWRRLQGVA